MKVIIFCLIVIVFLAFTIVLIAGLKQDAKETHEQMILDEILPQYEWENYAYKIEELTCKEHRKLYVATFYTEQGKFEFLVEVDGDDVDEELIEVTR